MFLQLEEEYSSSFFNITFVGVKFEDENEMREKIWSGLGAEHD